MPGRLTLNGVKFSVKNAQEILELVLEDVVDSMTSTRFGNTYCAALGLRVQMQPKMELIRYRTPRERGSEGTTPLDRSR